MDRVKDERPQARRVTREDAHYFFGYYDTPAWSGSDRYHLCHKVQFCHRSPRAEDKATLGFIDLADQSFHPVGETSAWNFQQGGMLQWHPAFPEDAVIYNARRGGTYGGVVHNIRTDEVRQLELPVANVDPTGKFAVSVNFDRLFDFRPGYGYAGRTDRWKEMNHPADDGVFLVDLASGTSRLVLTLQRIWEATGGYFGGEDRKLLINHITFNTDGTRMVFLVRCFPEAGGMWETAVMTANRDGSGLFLLADYTYASHYHWRDSAHIAIHARITENGRASDELYVLKDGTHDAERIDDTFFLQDGHCSYSPDRRFMMYDSYPDAEQYRSLYVYDLREKRGIKLGSYYSEPELAGDIRCDLHPRWNRQGTCISFDSTHEGHRHVYTMDLRDLRGLWQG